MINIIDCAIKLGEIKNQLMIMYPAYEISICSNHKQNEIFIWFHQNDKLIFHIEISPNEQHIYAYMDYVTYTNCDVARTVLLILKRNLKLNEEHRYYINVHVN